MSAMLRKLIDRLHLWVALLTIWVIATSPWVAMLRRIPESPGFFDRAHIWAGALTVLLTVPYCVDSLRNGRWQAYFPWAAGRYAAILADLKGLARGTIPSAEGGGLFGTLEGLTLLALIGTGLTGVAWLWTEGTADALYWRSHHLLLARVLIVTIFLHALSVSLHLLDFVKD